MNHPLTHSPTHPLLLCASLSLCLCVKAAAVPLATETYVDNKISNALSQVIAPDYSTNNTELVDTVEIVAGNKTNYYTRTETDEAINEMAAYYITANAAGDAFPTVLALTNAATYYSGGALRTPTRNDYAVVLADEAHGGAEWRYIYAVHEGATNGQWEAQYPIETSDYEALSNKPSINGVNLVGNKTADDLGLTTPNYANVSNAAMNAVQWYDGGEYQHQLAADKIVAIYGVETLGDFEATAGMGQSTYYGNDGIRYDYQGSFAQKIYFPWAEEYGITPDDDKVIATRGDIIAATNGISGGADIASTVSNVVPAWAMAATKPTYTASEVDALPNDATLAGIANFSNAVLQVGLNIDTNAVAAINALVEAGDELPIGGAATVGGLLLALAAAVAALKRGKADATALRYDIGTESAITSASQEEVEGVTVNYGAATLADRTANRVAITAALDELRLAFPAADSGKVRDFGLRVEVGDGTAALTAPALVPVAPTGETVTLENPDGAIPALADGAADAKGVTLLYFSETAPGVFLAKGEEVKEA